ncbi:hypothetical protein EG329_007754 [Mollisiaceae sp. DMI_Dod_QoI]|nr:hypothetical protein EG329_007754 [Helotiales sp. DMI_Dod_QoI]
MAWTTFERPTVTYLVDDGQDEDDLVYVDQATYEGYVASLQINPEAQDYAQDYESDSPTEAEL